MGEVETELAAFCSRRGLRYALAAFSAAARLAPFVRYQRASAFIDEEASAQIVQALDLKEVSTGANVSLWTPYDEGVWYGVKKVDGATETSPIQTYLDLHSMHGRGEEAADSVLNEVIIPAW